MKQIMARKAEKALKEILDKADSNFNGKVELKRQAGLEEFISLPHGCDLAKQ